MFFSCLVAPPSFELVAVVIVDDDDDVHVDDERRSESSLGCFRGGGVASEVSLSMEDLRFEPCK